MSFYIQLTLLAASAVMGLTVGDGRFAGGQANMEFLLRAWIVPTPGDLALFAASGFTVAIGGFAISQAYRLAAPPRWHHLNTWRCLLRCSGAI